MPNLPSGGFHTVERAGSGAASPLKLAALRDGAGVDELAFVVGATAQYELVDTTDTGVFLIVAAGAFPGMPRCIALRSRDGNTTVYSPARPS